MTTPKTAEQFFNEDATFAHKPGNTLVVIEREEIYRTMEAYHAQFKDGWVDVRTGRMPEDENIYEVTLKDWPTVQHAFYNSVWSLPYLPMIPGEKLHVLAWRNLPEPFQPDKAKD